MGLCAVYILNINFTVMSYEMAANADSANEFC